MWLTGLLYKTGWFGPIIVAAILSGLLVYRLVSQLNRERHLRLSKIAQLLITGGFAVWPVVFALGFIGLMWLQYLPDNHTLKPAVEFGYRITQPIWIVCGWIVEGWSLVVASFSASQVGTTFWPLSLGLYFVPLALIFSLPFIVIIGSILLKYLPERTWRSLAVFTNWSLLFITIALIAQCLALGSTLAIQESCRTKVNNLHMFNAHLKDLCVERADKSQCPRNESQLKAFNPRRYRELQSCATTKYTFNAKFDSYEWLVNDRGLQYRFAAEYYPGGYKTF